MDDADDTRIRKGWYPDLPTDAQRAALMQALAEGNFRETACKYAAIPTRTFYRWCALGRKQPSSEYGRFFQSVLEAEAQAELEMVELVRKSAKIDAKHAQWWLERKLPQQWGSQRAEIESLRKRLAEIEKNERSTKPPETPAGPTPTPPGDAPRA